MKKRYTFLLAGILGSFSMMSQSRYIDEVFTSVTVSTDVKYGENYSVLTGTPVLSDLKMDVYEPSGDTAVERPLVILAHAGSFLPKGLNTLPLGNKLDSCMVELCMRLAKRGYIAVSMDYRLGWNPTSTDPDVRAGTIINAVYRGMQDMKACVRFFKLSSSQSTYKVDTNAIVVGGSNSGGYMALAYGSLDQSSELNLLKFKHSVSGLPYVNQAVTGGFDGEGGMAGVNNHSNPGPTSDAHLTLNLGGAIGDTSWQNAGEIPIISFHGVADALTPYKTAVVVVASTGQSVVEVSGSHDLSRYATALGNQVLNDASFTDVYSTRAASLTPHKGLYPFLGAANGYEPWGWYDPADANIDNTTPGATGSGSKANPFATPAKGKAYIDTILGYFCPRAVSVLNLGGSVGINESFDISKSIQIYPNPSSDIINVSSDYNVSSISITDISGKQVLLDVNERNKKFQVNVSGFDKGIYFMRINTDQGIAMKKLVVN